MSNSTPASRMGSTRRWARARFLPTFAFVCVTVFSLTILTQSQAEESAPTPVKAAVKATKRADMSTLASEIDQHVEARLQEEKIPASGKATDAEFLRRVYLDIIGVVPPAEKVAAFLDSKDPNKRAKVIDELLENPRFGKYMAEMWAGQMVPNETNNRRLDSTPLQTWLADNFNKNTPMDKLVYNLVTSTGSQTENGAVTYFIGNPTVDKVTDNVTRMFLGVQLQCAQCHNHPFVEWKQEEYWSMAAFFMRVRLTANPQQAAKKGMTPGIYEEVVKVNPNATGKGKNKNKAKIRKPKLPESAKIVPAKFLQGAEPKVDLSQPARPVLAKWMTSPENPFFARAMVNRIWYQMFGRGLVNPVDDMHAENPPTHPELLDYLTEQFKASGFDTKNLVRAICNSESYQRSSVVTEGNAEDNRMYSHRFIRVLSPEQLYDSLAEAIGSSQGNQQVKGGKKKGGNNRKGGAGPRDAFLKFFRIDEGVDPLEYQSGIPQVLRLMNSPQLNNFNGLVSSTMKSAKTPEAVIERLTLTALARRPTPAEMQRFTTYVGKASDARTAYSDVFWALINSSEFALNH